MTMTNFAKNFTKTAGVGAAALALTIAMPGSAHAATVNAACTTTGASGFMRFTEVTNEGPGSRFQIKFEITDTKADDHHARVRLVTKNGSGATVRWKWHANTSGVGTVIVNTTAQDSDDGIFNQGIQVARFEKNDLLNDCTDWAPWE